MSATSNGSRPPASSTRDLFDLLTGDENARVCRDIPDSACREQPTNFFIHLISLIANKTGDLIASPKLVLPWLFGTLGTPVWMIGMLVPLRESLALLPQLAVAGWMRAQPRRKWFWVGGALVQGTAVIAMIGVALIPHPKVAGGLVLLLLAIFSLGRGVSSVAYKDVQGKTIAKTRRGTLSGYAASVAGGLTVILGICLWFVSASTRQLTPLLLLLGLAGLLWFVAAAVFAGLREYAGATQGGGNALKVAWQSLYLIRSKPGFAQFIGVRGLLVATALAAPYYAELARRSGGHDVAHLALLLALSGFASLVFAPFWGRFSDRSSRRVLIFTGLCAAVLDLAVAAAAWLKVGATFGLCPFALAYFLLSGLHAGVRLGRKTYLTDLADRDNRAQLTAIANTSIGVILLVGGAATAAIGSLGAPVALIALALAALLAAALAIALPETE